MEIYRDLEAVPGQYYNKLVLALGNFDGVHLGHQHLIRELIAATSEAGGIPALLTFDPHPMKVLNPDNYPPLLMEVEDKIESLKVMGIEALFLLPFSHGLAKLSAENFIKQVLIEKLGIKGVIVGYNYSFGFKGQGNPSLLEKYAKKYNFFTRVIPPVSIENIVVSSTEIRNKIQQGQMEKAALLLGKFPFIKGRVIPGDQRGRKIGFPTANLDLLADIISPPNGVYAVRITGLNQIYGGVANIGTRPTFLEENQEKNLEVHIFDLDHEIYGENIKVEFLARLRGETTFPSVDQLISQIQQDVIEAKFIVNRIIPLTTKYNKK